MIARGGLARGFLPARRLSGASEAYMTDQDPIQSQREIWQRARAQRIAREAEAASDALKHNGLINRAAAREHEERAKLEAMVEAKNAENMKYLAEPEEPASAEDNAAIEKGEGLPQPDAGNAALEGDDAVDRDDMDRAGPPRARDGELYSGDGWHNGIAV